MGYVLPGWLDEILDFIGINWPNVDEDDYREMADAMRELANAFDDHTGEAHAAVNRLLSSSEGSAVDALQDHWGQVRASHLEQLPEAARLFANAMDVVADVIYGMKVKAEIELGVMAASAGVSIGLAFVTGGLSALLGAAQITAMREVVRRIIREAADQIVDQVMAMVTEPVAAKLESMVTDAVLDLASGALSPGATSSGGSTGAPAMNLNSAGGTSGGAGGGGAGRMRIDHAEYDKAAGDLGRLSESSLARLSGPLDRAHNANNRTRGKDAFTQGIDSVVDGATKGMKKAVERIVKHTGETIPKNLRNTSENHRRNEKSTEDSLRRILSGHDGRGGASSPLGATEGPRGRPPVSSGSKGDEPVDPSLSQKGREAKKKCFGGDPVDMATGEVYLSQTDVLLPGVLPLTVKRTHLSHYRHGRFFGPSWASTLDERLESATAEAGGELWWHRTDGSSLRYSHAPDLVGELVHPREGRRLALTRVQSHEGWDLAVHDPHTGLTRRFLPASGEASPTVWWLMELSDRRGNALIIERDSEGVPTSVSHSSGDYQVDVRTNEGAVTGLVLHGDQDRIELTRYGYDADRNLTEVTNSSGLPLRFTYDSDHRMTSWTDRNGSTYGYVYDPAGRVEQTVGPDGCLSSRLTYDTERRITRYTDSTAAVTTYHFNELGQVISESDPLGHTRHTEWDRYDQVRSRTDALGRTIRFEYDEHGNTTAVVHPDGSRSETTYNRLHLPVEVVLPSGVRQRQEYDIHGNRTAVTDVSGATTRFAYNELGHLATITDPLGSTTALRCNAAGLPTEVTDPLGAVTRYQRNALGYPVAITDPVGATTWLEWTVEGKPASRTAADGTVQRWTYDGEGNCTSHTDANGSVTSFEYTHFDKLAARTGPDGARYVFGYDTELRVTSVTSSQGLTWQYQYDPAGRLISETDFDGRTVTYTHDAAGKLATRTTASGDVTSYERDALGRTTCKNSAGAVTSYEYDTSGRLRRASGPDATLVLQRDAAGRVLSETVNGRTVTYTYDLMGRRTGRVTPTGASSTWTHDAAGRGTHLTAFGHTVAFSHDASGREVSRAFGDSLGIESTFDALGRMTGQSVRQQPQGASLIDRTYTYRGDGHLSAVDDQLNGPRRFDLDRGGKVTAVHGARWTETYAYDAEGNQTQATWPSVMPGQDAVGVRTYSGTRIRTAGRVRYEHDEAGRVTLRQRSLLSHRPETWRYQWDSEDRLIGAITPDGTHWRYRYDPLGRRTAKQRLAADGRTVVEQTDFSWDGVTLCEQTTHQPGKPTAAVTLSWEHRGLRPLAQAERKHPIGADLDSASQQEIDERFYAIITDLVGTPTELLDERGNIAWRARATLWGTTVWNRGATAHTPLRFPGQYSDPETGLHYNYFRHYDPEVGRYVTADPLGLQPAPNPSAYVANPHTWIDPLGLAPDEECENGGSWDPEEEPYLYRGVGYADEKSPEEWRRMYENALQGRAEPLGGHSDPQLHAGGDTNSEFTSWTTYYEDMALEESYRGNGPGVVLRIPNGDGPGYSRVPGVSYPYDEGEVTIRGPVHGAETSVNGGPWTRPH